MAGSRDAAAAQVQPQDGRLVVRYVVFHSTLDPSIYISLGILCWEVYADGADPYPGLTNLQTRAKIVVQNYRMEMSKVSFYGLEQQRLIPHVSGHPVGGREAGLLVLGQGPREAPFVRPDRPHPQGFARALQHVRRSQRLITIV